MKKKSYAIFAAFQARRNPFHHFALLSACLLTTFPFATAKAQQPADTAHALQEVVISSGRVGREAPIVATNLDRRALGEGRIVASLPFLVAMTPGVVATGENGTVGNTSLRIRGVDGTRVNVCINGIPLNDPESQMVYWVNIPNLAGMAQSLQVQRGVCSSTGGTASLGGAINLQTLNAPASPYATAELMAGSWNTHQYGFTAGTGITQKGFAFDAAYSGLSSDGYVRNGFTDQRSLFVTASHFGVHSLLKAVVIVGRQHTGITWNGASAEDLDTDPTFNNAGAYHDAMGTLRYYDNESDNYSQRHYQLYYSWQPSSLWTFNAAGDITCGSGYYEQYFEGGLSTYLLPLTDTGDCVARMEEGNHAYTATLSARRNGTKSQLDFGGMALYFDSDHWGEVAWSQSRQAVGRWYGNKGQKGDASAFARLTLAAGERTSLYGDLQCRYVDYRIEGTDEDRMPMSFSEQYLFFNPKAGLRYALPANGTARRGFDIVAGLAHREPSRADIKDALRQHDSVRAEQLLDFEAAFDCRFDNAEYLRAGAYAMLYNDQLVANGRLSESGYPLMENVAHSYRVGLEIEGAWQPLSWMLLTGNIALSDNRIIDYRYRCNDLSGNIAEEGLGNTRLAFSPSVVGAAGVAVNPWRQLRLLLTCKYVGEMYADNTSRSSVTQPAYFLADIKASYTFRLPHGAELEAQFLVGNIFNQHYRLSAWVADYGTDGLYRGYYQQPGTNIAARIVLKID